MYRCTLCRGVVQARQPCIKRTTQKRVKHYPERPHAKYEWREVKGKWKKTPICDPGGVGYETVVEANCCLACAHKLDKALTEGKISG